MKRSVLVGWSYLAMLLGLAGVPSDADVLTIVVVVGCAACLAITVALLVERGALVPLLPPLLHGFAYFPQAWDFATHGAPFGGMYAHRDAVLDALSLMTGFACAGSTLAYWLSNSRAFKALGTRVSALSAPGGDTAFRLAFLCYFAILFVAAVRDGGWTFYSAQGLDPEADEVGGLALQYKAALPAALVACAFTLRQVLSEPATTFASRRALLWTGLTLVVCGLIFLSQSRRMLLGCCALFLLIENRHRPRQGKSRIVIQVVLTSAAVVVGLVGSYVWREAVMYGTRDNEGPLGQLQSTLDYAENTAVSTDEVLSAGFERVKYLPFESTCIEYLGDLHVQGGIGKAFLHTGVRTIPSALLPDKQEWEPMSCETATGPIGIAFDLPCTATCHAWIAHGTFGLLFSLAFWALGIALAEAMGTRPTVAGMCLLGAGSLPYMVIETSAFPIFVSIRNIVIIWGFTGALGLAAALLRGTTHPR